MLLDWIRPMFMCFDNSCMSEEQYEETILVKHIEREYARLCREYDTVIRRRWKTVMDSVIEEVKKVGTIRRCRRRVMDELKYKHVRDEIEADLNQIRDEFILVDM